MLSSYFVLLVFVVAFAFNANGSANHKRPLTLAKLTTTPGCDYRPTCPNTTDERCKDARYFKDVCFPNVYWECAFGKPVPVVCSYGLVVNPAAIANPDDTSVALCDRPQGAGGGKMESTLVNNGREPLTCGCSPQCNVPPTCPKKDVVCNDCKGAIYLPFRCDCQFYWVCDVLQIPHLQACGAGFYFRPRGDYSGNCVPSGGAHEATACLQRIKKRRPAVSKHQNN